MAIYLEREDKNKHIKIYNILDKIYKSLKTKASNLGREKMIMGSRGQAIPLIEEAIKISHGSRASLVQLFPEGQSIPILGGHESHPYFNLYKVRGPAEVTEDGVYVSGVHKAQIAWENWPKPGDEIGPTFYRHDDEREQEIALVLKDMRPPETYLIIGPENCRKQLEQWGVLNPQVDKLL